jgi:tyrosine-protein phosphatase YwqE
MTSTICIALSTKGLKSANRIGRKDFRFISGSDTFICDRFQAMFVSPRVARLIDSDYTIVEFIFDHANSESFEILANLIWGDAIEMNEFSTRALLDLIEDLANSD